MPHITVSRKTHDRIAAHAIGTLNTSRTKFNTDGTVTIWVEQDTKDRLDRVSPDTEAAINKAIDAYEGRDTRN